ncbi:MAG: alanine--tRNA ligase-related protein [Limisphaerales bacterium]
MTSAEIRPSRQVRQDFLDFFKSKQHAIVPSSSLMPDAPNLLFTNAGMNQFVPIFLGQRKPDVSKWPGVIPGLDTRAADTQKCIRAGGKHNDLEDVGLDTYHHTFFEMLGNWSFGDYFKQEAIEWAWELITEIWKFPKGRLYATIYQPGPGDPAEFDQEACDHWTRLFMAAGLDPKVHVRTSGKKDNFWMMGETGPCGPCSEIHIDLTPAGDTDGKLVNAGSAECIEIWNLVFIQFNANPDGTFSPLPARHVDTGMGFERVASMMQCTRHFTDFSRLVSNYETDIFRPIFDAIEKLSGRKYGSTLPGPELGGTGDPPVPVGDPPTGMGVASSLHRGAGQPMDALSGSAGLVAQRDGQVARSTQGAPGVVYSRRNLPHFEKPWAIYHVIINTIAARKLSPAARDLVLDCILHWRESRYRLVAACVLPDHAHFIIQPGVKEEDAEGNPVFWPLSDILHSIKSYSGKEVNKVDHVKGTLWQEERYDRYMRSDLDLQEKFQYICQNPWAAGLVRESEPWPWLWTPDIEACQPYRSLAERKGGTGDPPVPVGDPPTGMGVASSLQAGADQPGDAPSGSAGLVAQRDGQVARSTRQIGPSTQEQVQLDVAFRVIADHIRTLGFAIADGIQPSNDGRGYVLRRILRRAVRYGRTLGFHEPFFYKLIDVLADTMGEVFPEIRAKRQHVKDVIRGEEEAFSRTLEVGLRVFDEITQCIIHLQGRVAPLLEAVRRQKAGDNTSIMLLKDDFMRRGPAESVRLVQVGGDELQCSIGRRLDGLAKSDRLDSAQAEALLLDFECVRTRISGGSAFMLYDTYGFPLDLTELMARERGLTVDVEGFNRLMEEQKTCARAAQKKTVVELSQIETTAPTRFVGYENLAVEARVLEVVQVKDRTAVILDTTSSYAEMGGQVGDTGELSHGAELWRVVNTQKSGNTWLHLVEVQSPESKAESDEPELLVAGNTVTLSVDRSRRSAIQRHHTVTHLLHWALHEVVSKDATQKGSYVGPEKLTFDFNSPPLTPQQVADIEQLVNERILENAGVSWIEAPYAKVKPRKDVMQFFGDKYGDVVRVVQIGGRAGELDGYSMELCGGTHTRATGEIGLFRIVAESAIAAGVRRIEAVAGLEAYRRANDELQLVRSIAGKVSSPVGELEKKIETLLEHQKALEKQLKAFAQKQAAESAKGLLSRATTVNGVPAIIENCGSADGDTVQAMVNELKGQFKGVIVLGGAANGAVALVASVSPEFTSKVQAGKIIQQIAPIVGGKGGGKPDNARGGGKDTGKLDEALQKAIALLG